MVFKLIKWLFSFISVLAMLLLAAALIVPRVFNPNDYRDDLAALVKQKTGRELTLGGNLSVSVFPWLGVRAYDVSFSQPVGLGKGNMLQVGEVDLKVKVLPLFKKQVEVATVVLKQPTIHIITSKEGITSLDGLNGDKDGDQAIEKKDQPAQQATDAALALVVQGVYVEDGNIIWDDLQTEQLLQVRNLQVKTGNLIGAQLVPLSVQGELLDSATPDITSFDINGMARINIANQQVDIRNLKANLQRGDFNLQTSLDEAVVQSDLSIVINGLTVQSQALDTGFGEAQINGFIPSASFKPANGVLRLSAMQASGKVAQRAVLVESRNIQFDSKQQTLAMPSLTVQSEDLQASITNLQGSRIIDAPNFIAALNVQPFDAQKLLNELEIDYQPIDNQALRKLALSARLSGSLNEASFSDVKLIVDETTLTGNAFVQNFTKPATSFDLQLNQIDLDRYLPIDEEGVQSNNTTKDAAVTAAAMLVPMALFKDMNANGSFKANKLKSGGVELENIDVAVASTPGNVSITPTAKLYDGSIGGKVEYSESADTAQLRIKNNIDLVDLSRLFTAADVTDQLSGIGSLDIDLLITEVAGKQSNSGSIKLLASNGAIQGVDIKKVLIDAKKKYNEYRGRETEEVVYDENDETRFAELLGTFNLNDFVISNKDFALKAPLFRVNGDGDINIAQNDLDYLVTISVVNTSKGQGGEALSELKGIPLPVRFFGDITSPKYKIDFKAMYELIAKRKINEGKDDYLERKLGVEEGSQLSSKELLRQALLKKAEDKYSNKDESAETQQGQQSEADVVTVEDHDSQNQNAPVEDISVQSEPQAEEPELTPEQRKEKAKDELKQDAIEGLLDAILN